MDRCATLAQSCPLTKLPPFAIASMFTNMREISSQSPLRGAAAFRPPATPGIFLAGVFSLSAIFSGCASVSAEKNPPDPATAKISVIPSRIDFKSVVVGQKNSQTIQVTNSATEPIDVQGLHVSGPGFSLSSANTRLVLAPGMHVNLSIVFAPSQASSSSGALVISSSDLKAPVSVPLSGSGEKAVPALQASPASLNFGSLAPHTSTSQSVTLKNTGNVALSLSSVNLAGSAFSLSGLPSGVSLAPDQKVEFQVTFRPVSSGPSSGALTVNSSSLSAPVKIAISGSGTASTPVSSPSATSTHSVTLDWNASSSTVAGYHIYRGGSSGGPYSRINGSAISSLNYLDTSVSAGNHYFYVVTAVESNGAESAYSNEVAADIPN
jgi:hypothetical protein